MSNKSWPIIYSNLLYTMDLTSWLYSTYSFSIVLIRRHYNYLRSVKKNLMTKVSKKFVWLSWIYKRQSKNYNQKPGWKFEMTNCLSKKSWTVYLGSYYIKWVKEPFNKEIMILCVHSIVSNLAIFAIDDDLLYVNRKKFNSSKFFISHFRAYCITIIKQGNLLFIHFW